MNGRNVINLNDLRFSENAYWVLKVAFVFAPILAGVDKFFNNLTDWTQYLAPVFPSIFNITPQTFMEGVGIIEVIAGIGVLLRPRIFSYIVSLWMLGIILNLLILGSYYDIALRDLGLAIGAFALGQLSALHEHQTSRSSKRISRRQTATT